MKNCKQQIELLISRLRKNCEFQNLTLRVWGMYLFVLFTFFINKSHLYNVCRFKVAEDIEKL